MIDKHCAYCIYVVNGNEQYLYPIIQQKGVKMKQERKEICILKS